MTQRETILRHLEIINLLKIKEKATFEEIENHLIEQGKIHKNNLLVSKRTFQRDINSISLIYNIEIVCDRNDDNMYYIKEDLDDNMLGRYAMEAFETFSAFTTGYDLKNNIFFESSHSKGTKNLPGLMHAIRNKITIHFMYNKFYENDSKPRIAYPLALREYNGGWFLIAYCTKKNAISSFAIDRINKLEISDEKYFYQPEYTLSELVENCFGIDIPDLKDELREVILLFSPSQARLIKAFPLHKSQVILSEDKKGLQIQLTIRINQEFFTALQQYTGEVKIVSPKSLRKEYLSFLKKGIKMNES